MSLSLQLQPHVTHDLLLYLGADDVIGDVTSVISHLEKVRQSLVDSLDSERQRRAMLSMNIDELAAGHVVALPAAVQKGH